jgi:hypothetical protein
LERFLAVSQPFISRFKPFLGVPQTKNAWLHTVSMRNGDFEMFLHVLGFVKAKGSKFCVVTSSIN